MSEQMEQLPDGLTAAFAGSAAVNDAAVAFDTEDGVRADGGETTDTIPAPTFHFDFTYAEATRIGAALAIASLVISDPGMLYLLMNDRFFEPIVGAYALIGKDDIEGSEVEFPPTEAAAIAAGKRLAEQSGDILNVVAAYYDKADEEYGATVDKAA